MNIIAITTIAPGRVVSTVYFFDGIEISAAEYAAIQHAALERAYDELRA